MMNNSIAIDYFRILCCIGVLVYHTFDDILDCGALAKIIYFSASYCIPGFFLLSGFLLAYKKEITLRYIINKSINLMLKLIGWISIFILFYYLSDGNLHNIFEEFYLSAFSSGILPVGWFMFSYCAILLLSYPLFNLLNKNNAYIYIYMHYSYSL